MEWFYTKRRGPEWKQGWTGQTVASISTPPAALLTVFGIVIVLLLLSQYTQYNSQLHHTATNFKLSIFLLPILLIFFMAAFSSSGRYNFQLPRIGHGAMQRAGGSPWGLAILVLLVLVLLSYQSSFHSSWFGPLWRSG
ncbi:hypothetical protein CFOL_v3_34892 [Cephalotus follicularis]|uniref:Uncharacterized protein n=1 Tax=Cephalotus follicularis TaxID=3775 RepID=A0A1Q3DG80_CEPFO|nr:hypothetical protein CFOL_v3_34892 [Cephalotus follicularis]